MKIYKITSPHTDLVYVGKTKRTLVSRLYNHRADCKKHLEGFLSKRCSSWRVLEHGDCSIELIEETEDASREGFWIRELQACNKLKLGGRDWERHAATQKKRYHNNRDTISAKGKKYYEDKKDVILERMKERIACDNCGKVVSSGNMLKHKKTKRCRETSLVVPLVGGAS
jgi:hypothetical protein